MLIRKRDKSISLKRLPLLFSSRKASALLPIERQNCSAELSPTCYGDEVEITSILEVL
jgi:hypothetical protein